MNNRLCIRNNLDYRWTVRHLNTHLYPAKFPSKFNWISQPMCAYLTVYPSVCRFDIYLHFFLLPSVSSWIHYCFFWDGLSQAPHQISSSSFFQFSRSVHIFGVHLFFNNFSYDIPTHIHFVGFNSKHRIVIIHRIHRTHFIASACEIKTTTETIKCERGETFVCLKWKIFDPVLYFHSRFFVIGWTDGWVWMWLKCILAQF